MSKRETEEANLIAKIRNAFAGVVLGDGISLNMTEYLDSYETSAEFLEKAKFDEREDWASIPDETLEKFQVTFCFTDTNGYRFYLPAYMIWTIKNSRTNDNFIGDHVIYGLDVESHTLVEHKIIDEFTEAQIICLVEFLNWCVKNDDVCDGDVAAENLGKLRRKLAAERIRFAPE